MTTKQFSKKTAETINALQQADEAFGEEDRATADRFLRDARVRLNELLVQLGNEAR